MSNRVTRFRAGDLVLYLQWNGERSSQHAYVWLKDNEPGLWHANGQKLTDTTELDMNIQPELIEVTDDSLRIKWKGAPTITDYPFDWLHQFIKPPALLPIQLWENQLDLTKVTFDYNIVIKEEDVLLNWLKTVAIFGWARLKNVPVQSGIIAEVVRLFGYIRETNYGRIYDVKAIPNPDNLADSNLALAPHTDNPYRTPPPSLQLLHSLKAQEKGGTTILIDGFKIAASLKDSDPRFFELLCKVPVRFKYEDECTYLESKTPLIGRRPDGSIRFIRFNNRSIQPFDIDPQEVRAYYRAYQKLEQMLQDSSFQIRFKMEPGELVIFDNERILHGRTAINPQEERHLQGCYADRDSLLSKIEVLRKRED